MLTRFGSHWPTMERLNTLQTEIPENLCAFDGETDHTTRGHVNDQRTH